MAEKASWEAVGDGGGAHPNEDWTAVFERPGTTDMLVLSGGGADVVWFVRRFTAEFERALDAGAPRAALLEQAARATGEAWDARTGGRAIEPWAWPVASLCWLRVTEDGGARRGHLTSLGDCKALLRPPGGVARDLDPFDNAQEASLYGEVAALREAGVLDPAERFARLLPSLRARRARQNLDPAPAVLGVRPQGPFATRELAFDLAPGAVLLAMSDGFWRLVDPYALLTPEQLLESCVRDGLHAVLARLRDFERGAGGAASLAVKRADDASALIWRG
jgi:hypothetical protein